jgi:uncharacterized protein with HEPN domain
MEQDDIGYLEDIEEAISYINEYVSGLAREDFASQKIVQDAVVRQLEIIGEATKRLSTSIRQENPQIPWRSMAGMRDRLIHGYFDVNIEQVWLTVRRDLPELQRQVNTILAKSD